MTTRIAIVGLGKIARDQHVPAIAANPDFTLVATADPAGGSLPDVAGYKDIDGVLAAGGVDAVAVCTPPQVRAAIVAKAMAAGLHVLMEKPPAPTVSEAEAIAALAKPGGPTLFASWHSRFAPAIEQARTWVQGRTIRSGRISWREDAHRWHPGQAWLWQPGGFGVYDPGINALSILTRLVDAPIAARKARHELPANADAPIAATLTLRTGTADIAVDLDSRQQGPQTWELELDMEDGGNLLLVDGGDKLRIDGADVAVGNEGEYPALYRHFAALIAGRASEVELAPLRLVADAFMLASNERVERFDP